MSQYIHEIVLQEFIVENVKALDLSIRHNTSNYKLIEARHNKSGTFWDIEGKLENGKWIPIEVEWISGNFLTHKHHKSKDYSSFLKKKGVLIVLRKNREIERSTRFLYLKTNH
jgi:hypothetical protein